MQWSASPSVDCPKFLCMTVNHALKFIANQRHYSYFCRTLCLNRMVIGKILTTLWKHWIILWGSFTVTNHFLSSQPSVRKTHNGGRKHKENVRFYYTKWMEEQAQSLIDQTSMWLFFVLFFSFLCRLLMTLEQYQT